MTRPTKHPKTRTYLVRMAIPSTFGTSAKPLYGVGWELGENLGTEDATEARRFAPEVLARLREKLERAAQVIFGPINEPTRREIAALAGSW